ncbi:MAG: 2-C-methyl-D-erythritol 2,4-cyclodiphosphate synthase [Elusimicrobia bacterium RIFOXYA2_FULL_39_19]|nr:MAG: 2-C-methyl-D-erythritol 2,4-cyclodiphosphate synthase [Elusimicrobia bacterium RIFOXYA2_FULL_39_19]
MSIGIGYDIHKLVKGRKLFLGGVEIPYESGLLGHSDADVILHSVCDALLGAAGMDDIGVQFPNSDKNLRNISSLILLERTFKTITEHNFKVLNIDCAVIAQEPKIGPHKKEMIKAISKILKTNKINIKATTNEGLGLIGKKQGIACFATVLLKK